MKIKAIFFTLFLLASNYIFSQDTVYSYYDKDWMEVSNKEDASFYRKAFPGSNKTWNVIDYYSNNNIQMTGTYKTKKMKYRHGHFVYYYENGQKKSEGDFLNNKTVGIWNGWYDNGNLQYEGNSEDGNAIGVWKYYHESGEKKSEGLYIKDEKNGLWKYWYTNGKLESEENYLKSGVCSARGYYDNGELSFIGNYINRVKQGEWSYWNISGRMTSKGKYVNGLKEGEWTRYFPGGEEMKLTYTNGKLSGKIPGGIVTND